MPAGLDSSNPLSYELQILTIVNNEGDGFDIRDIFVECNIYESIHRNFLLGEVIITDQVSFLENAKLFGQESIRIKFSQPSGAQEEPHDDDAIDQVFRIYKIEAITRLKGSVQAFKVNFCSPEMIKSKRTRISQAFRGSMTNIAQVIAEDHLNIIPEGMFGGGYGVGQPWWEVREKSQGDNYHVVIPNWTIGYAINWLCKQAQGIDSSSGLQDSFYWYQTAFGGYRIQSLASMMQLDYGGGRPFVYSDANSADGQELPYDKTGKNGEVGMGRRILGYKVETQSDVLKGVVNGLFSSTQTTVDNTFKFYTQKTYNFLEKHFSDEGKALDPHPFIRTLPETLHIGGKAAEGGDVNIIGSIEDDKGIGDFTSAYQILTSDSSFVNDDKDDIHQANHFTHLGSSQFRNAANQLLKYYTMSVLISARSDISVGQVINLDISAVRPGEEYEKPKFLGGNHLITEIKWGLTKSELRTNLKVIKDSVINNIETTEIKYGETETQ